ncbi:MAG: mechanosensitive ion channel [Longimicrobiales bacterium]|nr:mechanosensitive ion channel [Longimicrobiales bacterium]
MTTGSTPTLLAAVAFQDGSSLPFDLGEWLRSSVGLGTETQEKLLWSVVAVLLLWLLRRVVMRVVADRVESTRARYQWSKTSSYVAFVVGIVVVSQIWLETLQQLGTFLGLLSAGLAIALRDVVANFAGWLFILWRRPFELEDRIQLGDHAGDVVDLRLFQFTILEIGNWVAADQSTGRVIHVPNSRVFTEPLANYTAQFPYVWHELPVLVTFESDWRKAKRILEEAVDEVAGTLVDEAREAVYQASRRFLIHYRHVTPIVYTSVQDSGILLTIRFLSPARSRRGLTQGIWEKILDAFHDEPDVDFAYPTQRIFHNPLEGKEGARTELPEWIARGPASRTDS